MGLFDMTSAVHHMPRPDHPCLANDYERKAAEFHAAFETDIDRPMTAELLRLRKTLLAEEMRELFVEMDAAIAALEGGQAVAAPVRLNMLKEAADVQYVLSGMAVTFGWPIAEVYARVHASNMSKLGADGCPVRREDGKVLKGPNYHPPVLDDLL